MMGRGWCRLGTCLVGAVVLPAPTPTPRSLLVDLGWIWTHVWCGSGEPDHSRVRDVPGEQRGPQASSGRPRSHRLASITQSDPKCCRLPPRARTSWEPSAPPRSHRLCCAFASSWPEGRRPPTYLLQGARETSRLAGLSSQGGRGWIHPSPPDQPPSAPGPGDRAVPVPPAQPGLPELAPGTGRAHPCGY